MFTKGFLGKFVTPLVLADLLMVLVGSRVMSGSFGLLHTLGLLVGLFCGFLSFCFFHTREKRPQSRPTSTILALLFSPAISPFLFFLPRFAAGFVFGSFIVLGLSLSLSGLQEELGGRR